MTDTIPYSADRSLYGKLRRRFARMVHKRPAHLALKRPLLTFSFDDAPTSAAGHGAAILEKHGARGTYFISSGLMGRDSHLGPYALADEIQRLVVAGHEIACHTYGHIDCGKTAEAEITDDLDLNHDVFQRLGFPAATTFAYPYGDVSQHAKALLAHRFVASRALHHGLITNGSDLNQTPAVGIEGQCGEQTALEWLLRAKAEKAWLVLYTHDVRDQPSDWGCTPQVLERLVIKAQAMGFEIVTYAEGARRAQAHIAQAA